jgi:hypothetical protein
MPASTIEQHYPPLCTLRTVLLHTSHSLNMAASSRTQSPVKRLLNELQTYQSDPNDALDHLGPVNDDELMHWTAVMHGVLGTAYEGIPIQFIILFLSFSESNKIATNQVGGGCSTFKFPKITRLLHPRSPSKLLYATQTYIFRLGKFVWICLRPHGHQLTPFRRR